MSKEKSKAPAADKSHSILSVIILADAAFTFLNKVVPQIRDAINRGDIPPEEQAEVRRKYKELREKGGAAFSGPEYELSGR